MVFLFFHVYSNEALLKSPLCLLRPKTWHIVTPEYAIDIITKQGALSSLWVPRSTLFVRALKHCVLLFFGFFPLLSCIVDLLPSRVPEKPFVMWAPFTPRCLEVPEVTKMNYSKMGKGGWRTEHLPSREDTVYSPMSNHCVAGKYRLRKEAISFNFCVNSEFLNIGSQYEFLKPLCGPREICLIPVGFHLAGSSGDRCALASC